MEKLTSLTEDQLKILDQKREEWIRIGLCTDPADRPAAEAGARLAYTTAGLPEPVNFVWADNPIEAIRIQAKLTGTDPKNWSSSNYCWGQHDYWLSFYDTFDALGIEDAQITRGLVAVARSAGWWWPLERTVVFSERPYRLLRDNDNRLHCEDGPAMSYHGGFDLYLWHGTNVPADLIEEGWDAQRILSERNAEVRRCAIEKIGWDTFIENSNMVKVAEAPDPGNAPHTLSLWDVPEELGDMFAEPARVLLCTNGTPERDGTLHRFGLIVAAHHTDPVAAAAELYDMPTEAYRNLQIRT